MELLIHTDNKSNKLNYVLDHIFGQYFDIPYKTTSLENEYLKHAGPKLYYGLSAKSSSIYCSSFLEQGFDEELLLNKNEPIEDNILFRCPKKGLHLFDFDIFSAIFYLLSRYEEYLPSSKDKHDRYHSKNSILSPKELKDPPIDRWLMLLKEKLEASYPGLIVPYKNSFEVIASMDVDHYYDIKYKPWYIRVGKVLNSIKKGQLAEFKARCRTLFGGGDIFDQYDLFSKISAGHKVLFFLHLGKAAPYDESKPIDKVAINKVISKLNKDNHRFGIHPSYLSNHNAESLNDEFNQFTEHISFAPTLSRQHFLKLSFPKTYRSLIDKGIKEDYSLMYADQIGFRAGTAHPFYWYDLKQDKITDLRIIPNALMDVTLQQYMKLSIEESIITINELKKTCQKYNAPFIFIWHNVSMTNLRPWVGWNKVLRSIVSE